VAAKHIGLSSGPSGVYVEKMLAQLEINNSGGGKLIQITKDQAALPLSRGELVGQSGIDVADSFDAYIWRNRPFWREPERFDRPLLNPLAIHSN
jgi:hypothetical protein